MTSGTIVSNPSDHTLYAHWQALTIPVTVTFDANGGTAPNPASKTIDVPLIGTNYGTLATTTRTGYTFADWYTAANGGTQVTSGTAVSPLSDHTLYAHWTASTYAVAFDVSTNGGTGGQSASVTATYGSAMPTISTTAPTKTGHTFTGWYDASSGGTQYYTSTGASARSYDKTSGTTLYAQFTANTYTVNFNANGGGTPSMASKTVTYDSAYGTLATVSRTGYTFDYWYISGSGTQVSASTTVSTASDHTLYAHWTVNQYQVTFDSAGGTSVSSQWVNHGSTATQPTAPTRTGYTFNGWYNGGLTIF
ncbi:hypothetical protein Ga0100231_016970 [Opitutaceae bacterium TAV4]|nr:hypothetical protein Ga0100231_016970 [Opitutaceae bacterium TAV4]